MEARFCRCAATAVVCAVAWSPDLPVGKTAPRHLFAICTAIVIAYLVAVVTFLARVFDAVAAAIGHRGGDTTAIRVAGVGSAGVAIIRTFQGRTWQAGPVGADIPVSASVVVGAVDAVVDEETADVGIAAIIGAGVLIGALQRAGPGNAGSGKAGILGGACVAIFAARRVVGVDTATVGAAAIVGTRIGVVAIQGGAAGATAVGAGICRRAGVTVIAWHRVVDECAAILRGAEIGGAEILVTARKGIPRHTPALVTLVTYAALIPIITGVCIGRKLTPGIWITGVVSAWIAIAAGQLALPYAVP